MTVWWVAVAEMVVACLLAAHLAQRRARARTAAHDRLGLVVGLLAEVLADPDDRVAADAMMARLALLMGADSGTIGLPVGDRMIVLGTYGLTGPARTLAPGQGLAGRCWTHGRPLVLADLTTEPGYVEGGGQARSGIYVPARANGRVCAVLALEARRPDAFTTRDLRVLQPVADLVGTVVTGRSRGRAAADLERRLLPMLAEATSGHLERLQDSLEILQREPAGVERERARRAGTEAGAGLSRVVEGLLQAAEADLGVLAPLRVGDLVDSALLGMGRGRDGFEVDLADVGAAAVDADARELVPAVAAVLATAGGGAVRAQALGSHVVLRLPGDASALPAHVCRRIVERAGGVVASAAGGVGIVLTLPVVPPPSPAPPVGTTALPGPGHPTRPVGPRASPDALLGAGQGG